MSGETMGGENLRSVDPQPVDPHLNTLTRTLFRSLHQASGKFAMFGHQNETSNVIGPNTDSDVHAVTGTYPALWGSDLSWNATKPPISTASPWATSATNCCAPTPWAR